MATFLQMLQQAAGGITPRVGDPVPVNGVGPQQQAPTNEIVVTGPQEQERAYRPNVLDLPDRPQVDGTYVLNDNRIPPHQDDTKEILERKGMFGVKGTLRDVLGTLGDAFLVQSGNRPVYAPRREQERAGDALLGFTDNPQQAAERLAAMGRTEEAQQLMEAVRQEELRRAQIESLDASRQQTAASKRQSDLLDLRNYTARLLAAAGDDEQKAAYAIQQAERFAARLGLTLEDLAISPNMTPEERAVYAAGDMTVNQQAQIPLRERQLDQGDRRIAISQQNADSQRISATRPRAAPRPRAETDSERAIRIGNKPESERSRGEQAWYDRYNRQGQGRSSNRRAVPGTPPTNPNASRFRILN